MNYESVIIGFIHNSAFIIQGLNAGLSYRKEKMSLNLGIDLKTIFIIKPFGSTFLFGLNFDLN